MRPLGTTFARLAYPLAMNTRRSAGILLYRYREGRMEVLLAHPGGPFFGRGDAGNWSIPKGEPSPVEIDFELTARREFEEETGYRVPAEPLIDLGTVKQKGGKTVYAWGAEGDLDPARATSNTFSLEWPPSSGRIKTYPEIDRVEWFGREEARRRIKEAQAPLLDRLEAALANGPSHPSTPGDGGQECHPAMPARLRAVVFDLGGVLIDWNPRHLYRTLFGGDDAAMERFLADVCTPEWNARIDAGRPFAEAVEELANQHPNRAPLIHAYRERWGEMLGGVFEGTLSVVRELRGAGVPVYALSNWSAETFTLTRSRFPFLDELEGIVISGDVGVGKPDPTIFRHFMARFGLEADEIAFVDDSPANVATARELGIEAIRFEDSAQVRRDLRQLGFPLRDGGDAPRN